MNGMRRWRSKAVQAYSLGKGVISKDFPIPIYEAVKTYTPDVVEKNYIPPADRKVHPVRWRQAG